MKKIVKIAILVYKWFIFNFYPHKVKCNICNWKDFKFNSNEWHNHSICPKCNSQIRHRLFWGSIQKHEHLKKILLNKKILHFAPEPVLYKKLKKLSNSYFTADLFAESYPKIKIDYKLDITNLISIQNQNFDCIIAFDVLEHVSDYLKALNEIYSVLNVDGFCILTVPQKDNMEKTFEDITIVEPQERKKIFGQEDHLRIFGDDFKEILEKVGFLVQVIDENSFDSEEVRKNVLFPPILSNNPLATNYRKIYFCKK